MYNTGDLGVLLPNGEIQHLGRVDDQVKIKGFRVELDGVGEGERGSGGSRSGDGDGEGAGVCCRVGAAVATRDGIREGALEVVRDRRL